MGTARVEKVLIASHIDDRDELLRRLQEEGILHICEPEKKDDERKKVSAQAQDHNLKQILARLNHATSFLAGYAPKRKGGMFESKACLPADEFRLRVEEFNISEKLEKVSELSQLSNQLDGEERCLKNELELLNPWPNLKHPPSQYSDSRLTDARFLFFSTREESDMFLKQLEGLDASLESVKKDAETEYAVVIFPREQVNEIEDCLKIIGVKMIQLGGFDKHPEKEAKTRKMRLSKIEKEREELIIQARQMSDELSGFETALDLYENEELLADQYQKIEETEKSGLIEGWIRSTDRKRFDKVISQFESSEALSVKPGKKEEVPVALRNSPAVKPFEMIMNMYGTPDGTEADPTPFVAPFFALFFALCLTDAGYGLVIAFVTAYLIWVKKSRGNLIWILFYGGVLSILAGAATGSWFGNINEKLAISWLIEFRNMFVWFDPLKDPMPFFYLSLGVGFFQMMFGMGIGVVDGLRTRRFGHALFEILPWFLIYLSIAFIAGVLMGVLPESFKGVPVLIAIVTIVASLGITLVLSERPGPTPVTSAILMWAAMTAALMAGAKAMGVIPFKGIIIKAMLVGVVAVLWLYTVYKGFTEKNLKAGGVIFGALGLLSIVAHLVGMMGLFKSIPFFKGNLLLVLIFVFNLIFALSVLKGWGGRIVWGAYNIYSNTTGVLGVVLSYVRLMALGMVTAGIAMAFNEIAWMLGGIPVVSVILIILVLIIGHVYNLAMSALSGFVHTLRLQYVEFLPQFFTGGGTPFQPFELKTRYVKVTRRT